MHPQTSPLYAISLSMSLSLSNPPLKAKRTPKCAYEYEEPLTSKKKMQIKWGNLTHKSEEYGFDDETIAQYMDLSYDTKYLFEHL